MYIGKAPAAWIAGMAVSILAAPVQAESAPEPVQLAQASARRAFDIPAQPLAGALNLFGSQSGLQVTMDGAVPAGLSSRAVNGTYAPEEALRLLLEGSGIDWRILDGRTVVLTRVPSGDAVTLGPVTILGSRGPDVPLSNVPSSISYVPREEIAKQQATTSRIEEVIGRTVPGFNPTNQGVRQIRGRTAQVFMNGVPLNESARASSGSDLNILPPEHLEAIEVSRGANSAYGFGSPGGIIALTTPRAESEKLTFTTKLSESFNPHKPGGSSRALVYQSASQIIGNGDFHLGGSMSYDGLEFDPDGNRSLGFSSPIALSNQEERVFAFDGSVGYDIGDAGKLRLSATYSHSDVLAGYELGSGGVYRQTDNTVDRFTRNDEDYRTAHSVNLSYENADIGGSALKVEVFSSRVYTEAHGVTSNRTTRDEQTNEYLGLRSSVTTPLPALYDGLSATYGLDVIRNEYFRPVYFVDTGEVNRFFSPDVTVDSYAPYLQLEMPVGPLRLSGGVRHEEYRGRAETAAGTGGIQGGDIDPFDLTLFNAGIVYPLTDAVDGFASYTQGAEITQIGRAATSAGTASAIDPQPAKSHQYEIGVRRTSAPIEYGLSTFYTESDLLSSLVCDGVNPCTPLREPRQFWGLEGSADWTLNEQWGVGGVLTWQDGLRETSTGDVRRIGGRDVPPILVSTFIDFAPYAWWRNSLQFDFRGSRDDFGDSTDFGEGEIDSVLLVHLSAAFDVAGGELRVGARNLFNERYFSIPAEAGNTASTWVPEEGTRILVSYTRKW